MSEIKVKSGREDEENEAFLTNVRQSLQLDGPNILHDFNYNKNFDSGIENINDDKKNPQDIDTLLYFHTD